MEDKRKVNPFYIVAMIIAIAATAVIGFMIYTYITGGHGKETQRFPERARHSNLWLVDKIYYEDEDCYIIVAGYDGREPESDLVAFKMDEDEINESMFSAGSYYPEIYWMGEYSSMDITDMFFEGTRFSGLTYEDGTELTDIEDIEDDVMYRRKDSGGFYGDKIKLAYKKYGYLRVYDKGAILGFVNEKADRQASEIGFIMQLILILVIAVPSLSLCIGFLIIGGQREKYRASKHQ